MKNLIICGDSFSIGIGCENLNTEPYGSLLAKYFDLNLINYAKGSSTNLSIFLQVKYVVENVKNIDYVVVGTTCHFRTEWFPEKSDTNIFLDNTLVNYHQYPPYGNQTYPHLLKHPMSNDKRYKGEMFTENYNGIFNYIETILDKNIEVKDIVYYEKFKSESEHKIRLLKDYFLNFYDPRIERQKDFGQIVMTHNLLKKNNIKHLIIYPDLLELRNYIDDENLIEIDFLKLSLIYPDVFNTLHMSSEGHKYVFNKIIENKKLI
jgi:hypothetical protein